MIYDVKNIYAYVIYTHIARWMRNDRIIMNVIDESWRINDRSYPWEQQPWAPHSNRAF